jgi:hypothetical protein
MAPQFLQAWEAARHNAYWWASVASGPFLVVLAFFLSLCLRRRALRRVLLAVVVVVAFVWVAESTVMSVQKKWQLRYAAARTEEERAVAADRDTANLAFAPFIGYFWGVVYSGASLASYVAAGLLRPRRPPEATDRPNGVARSGEGSGYRPGGGGGRPLTG